MAKTSGNIKSKSKATSAKSDQKPAKEQKAPKEQKAARQVASEELAANAGFSFERMNFMLMIAGLVVIIIGFFLMTGSSNNDPAVFNEDIYSFRRITLAPIVIVLGFIIEIIAIMWKPRK